MNKVFRYFILSILLLLMLLLPASASQYGSILVQVRGGAVALYPVGRINGQGYVLNAEYGGEAVTPDQMLTPELALMLDGKSKSGIIKAPDLNGHVLFADLEPGLYLLAQRSAPLESELFQPFLVSIPWDGDCWDVRVDTRQPEALPVTGDRQITSLWTLCLVLSALGIVACFRQGRSAGG